MKNAVSLISALLLVFGLAGCATTVVDKTSNPGNDTLDRLAAVDLINVMMQVPRLHPETANTIELKPPSGGFGRQVHDVMKLAGYQVEINDSFATKKLLKYSKKAKDGTTYQIEVDGFRVKRAYALDGDLVTPQTSVFIYGADPSYIKLNDDLFIDVDIDL